MSSASTASETPSIALAPRRPLLGVPSSSIIVSSSAPCSAARAPVSAAEISPLTLATVQPVKSPVSKLPLTSSEAWDGVPNPAMRTKLAMMRAPSRARSRKEVVVIVACDPL